MNVGVLGTGFGSYHVELYSQMKEVKEIYVYGRNAEKLAGLREKFGVHTVTDIDEILHNKNIDLVDICLPSNLHREYAVKALEHGKHVLCETPVAYSLEDALAMQKAKERYKKQLMVDLFLQFEPAYMKLASFVKEGTFGVLKKFQIRRYTSPFWGDLGLERIVLNLMIHDIDFTTSLFGTTDQIQVTKTAGMEGQSAVTALLTYKDSFAEVKACSMMPFGYPFSVAFEAIFEKAAVRFYEDGYEDHCDSKLFVFTENHQEEIPISQVNSFELCLANAVQMIKTDDVPVNDISQAVNSLKVALAIHDKVTEKN